MQAGSVYFTTGEGQLYAVEAASGRERWTVTQAAWGPSPPAAAEGLVCVGGCGETLVAYDTQDGQELWRFRADGAFVQQPLIRDGRVYAVCGDDHLYALDSYGGSLLWQHKGEHSKELTTAPVAGRVCVFVGNRIYHEHEGERAEEYALLSLDLQDGEENWRFHTKGRVLTSPTVADDLVFFGSQDGAFYAVDATTGEETWRRELQHELVTQPQIAGDLVLYATRQGIVHAIRWRAKVIDDLLAPQAYEQEKRYEEAAAAYALQGAFFQAASIYEKLLAKPRKAARLYEQAGMPREAAAIWAELDELVLARDRYREAGDKLGLARVLERMGRPLQAAYLHEEINDLEEAARLYEQVGDRARAAELYLQLGKLGHALSIWKSLGHWEKQARTLIAAGRLAEAAQILEEHGHLATAAELYVEAGDLKSAVHVGLRQAQWESVAQFLSRISVAHPRLLSKRFTSKFLVHLYQGDLVEQVKSELSDVFGKCRFDQVVEEIRLELGNDIEIELHSPDIEFSDPVVKHLAAPVTRVWFIGKPKQSCKPGKKHGVLLSIRDEKTRRELESIAFDVQVVDYAFDHISRPLLSRIAAFFSGLGAIVLFVLTLLQQVDATLGLASGTAAGVLAVAIYGRFAYLFHRLGSTTSTP